MKILFGQKQSGSRQIFLEENCVSFIPPVANFIHVLEGSGFMEKIKISENNIFQGQTFRFDQALDDGEQLSMISYLTMLI